MSESGDFYMESFNNVDEFFLRMQQRREEADAGVLPKQREIQPGNYAIKLFYTPDRELLPIFLKTMTLEELLAEITDEVERDYEQQRYEVSLRNNLRYGEHFSVIMPDGEFGSSHLVSLWPIPQEDYEVAQGDNWRLSEAAFQRIKGEIADEMVRVGIT